MLWRRPNCNVTMFYRKNYRKPFQPVSTPKSSTWPYLNETPLHFITIKKFIRILLLYTILYNVANVFRRTLIRFVHKSNEVTDAPTAIELLYPPERYLTFAMRYNPSSKPVTLLVNGSSTAAQRFSKGGGGWPGLCAWVQDNNCSETGSQTCAITKNKCTEQNEGQEEMYLNRRFLSCV